MRPDGSALGTHGLRYRRARAPVPSSSCRRPFREIS